VASGWIRLPGAVARVGCRDGARHGRLRRRRLGRRDEAKINEAKSPKRD
jgi:hypothetical protein